MSRRRTALLPLIGLAVLAIGARESGDSPAAAETEPKPRPHGSLEKCATKSMAHFPGGFTSPRNLVVGPLVFVGAGGTPEYVEESGGQKFQLLVHNGHRVTVALPRRAREGGAGLAYGRLPRGEVTVDEAHRVVRFVACRRGQNSGSSADGIPVTFWSGGVLADSARCVPLRIRVDDERSPRRALIRLGVDSCG